ncbi:sulfur carrier protein ThiS [Rhodococcus sp. HNM0563]|uniref:sulfur carrier protein ThiS n=1 Tax=unclassified Rhodococcus (in: high G+C Gram-positive bacteria) TaxID=192944 RepID=UPI00146A15CC|nr:MULTISPECIES: sulfur carrier protein ThiS [unclassified Rhodococcus (in: high G+C Gram-positive bacteria)]MCK0090287.1 sulfur carrier protein ThiS [Rhodococcus sp. F64268]NLU61495.1 sulfur carrier protein ThiS [Rhodococcus sp. HNM0563]
MTNQISVGITVNGEEKYFADEPAMTDLLAEMGLPEKGIAVAVDGVLFPRGRWSEKIGKGAQVEILTAVQGG